MKAYAQKQNQPQQQVSSDISRPRVKSTAATPTVHAIMHLQRTIGNQAVQRLIHANAEVLDAGFDTSATTRFAHDFSRIPVHSKAPVMLQAKLRVNTPGDSYEQEADRVAEQVTKMPESQVQRACACGGGCPGCQNEQAAPERLQMKSVQASNTAGIESPSIVNDVLRSSGQPLDPSTRAFMESRFGHNFSQVRLHTDARAVESTNALSARAYTIGQDIAFGAGQYLPDLKEGRRLLAHELTHVVQQSNGTQSIQRKPEAKERVKPEKDPLCDTFDFGVTKELVSTQASAFKADPKTLQRHTLIRTLKLIWRCGTPEQQEHVRTDLAAAVSEKEATALWKEAGTPFGGYTGMYPGYAPDIKQTLKKLGVNESVSFTSFRLPFGEEGHTPAEVISEHRARSKKAAAGEVSDLARTDIIYFRGHQYAQYTAPGVFADIKEEFGFDLRYIDKAGGFPNVKLMISTSCATLCREALNLFLSLFPNAVILGFRKSDPKEGGAPLRDAFQAKVQALNRPLLLDQAVDVSAIISAWKSVAETVKGDIAHILPGYYDGGLNYWDGKAWQTVDPKSDENKCHIKKDARSQLPGPAAPK